MKIKFWHVLFFIFLLGFPTSETWAQQEGSVESLTQRRSKESILQFVHRQYSQWAVVENQVIETDEFGTEPPAIIAYYRKPYFYDGEESGDPQILAVFFADANQDKARELAIMVKWPQRHYDYEGAFYGTKIYDFDKDKNRFNFLRNLSNQFNGCECRFRDGQVKHAKYQTAAAVRAKLEEMGF